MKVGVLGLILLALSCLLESWRTDAAGGAEGGSGVAVVRITGGSAVAGGGGGGGGGRLRKNFERPVPSIRAACLVLRGGGGGATGGNSGGQKRRIAQSDASSSSSDKKRRTLSTAGKGGSQNTKASFSSKARRTGRDDASSNSKASRADGVAMEQHGEEVGWAAVEPLAKLLWEGKGTGGVGGGDEISIGWAKAVAACANSRVLTSVAPEDESALEASLGKIMPHEMGRGSNKEWRDRAWVLRISDVDRMWEDAIPQLTAPLGGSASKAGFQAMWSYLHGMLARGRLDSNLAAPSRSSVPLWDFVSVPAADRSKVFIASRFVNFNPVTVNGILRSGQSPEALASSVENLWKESFQTRAGAKEWHTLVTNAATLSWALWSGKQYPLDGQDGTGGDGGSDVLLLSGGAGSKQTNEAGRERLRLGPDSCNILGAEGTGKIIQEALAATKQVTSEESNFGSLPPKDKQIVIDGANVAWYFTDSSFFCTKGLVKCVEWFIKHGYTRLVAFVPAPYSQEPAGISLRKNVADDIPALAELEARGLVHLTPSQGDDDAFIIQYAFDNDGYIVSNDNYREFHKEAPEWKKQWLKTRKVFYTFVAGQFIPTAPKILRKGDAAVVEAGLRPPVDPALPAHGEMKEQGQGQGQGQGQEVAALNVEEECERRLMFYDEEDGAGEQLAWGVYPSGPPLNQDDLGGQWHGGGGGGGMAVVQHAIGECRTMLAAVMTQLERHGALLQQLHQHNRLHILDAGGTTEA